MFPTRTPNIRFLTAQLMSVVRAEALPSLCVALHSRVSERCHDPAWRKRQSTRATSASAYDAQSVTWAARFEEC